MIKRFRIEGIITAQFTPLTKDEQVKEDAWGCHGDPEGDVKRLI